MFNEQSCRSDDLQLCSSLVRVHLNVCQVRERPRKSQTEAMNLETEESRNSEIGYHTAQLPEQTLLPNVHPAHTKI